MCRNSAKKNRASEKKEQNCLTCDIDIKKQET